jgi:alpha-1,2-mannosyltransferase
VTDVPTAATKRTLPTALLVFAVAAIVRVAVVLRSGGFLGYYGYDPGVYYASADALVHGRTPYTDSFVFLHPPMISLVLTPFAWLGHLTSDHVGFVTANIAFTLLSALNAALVVLLAERMGLSRRSATIAGLFYALWFGAINAEFLARLEPLGNLFMIAGLYFVVTANERWPRLAYAGVAFGLATSVKAWFVVPLLIVAIWQLVQRRRPLAPLAVLGGAAAVFLVVDLPFLLLSGGRMWSMVVTEQFGRNASQTAPTTRLGDLSTIKQLIPHVSSVVVAVLLVPIGAAAVWLLVLAWRLPVARLMVVLAVLQTLLLGLAPSWFPFYTDFVAVPLALVVGAAMMAVPERVRVAAWSPVAYVAAITLIICITGSYRAVRPVHAIDRLSAAVAPLKCVMSDAPSGLIEVDALDRGLGNGCRNWIDVTGRTYGADKAPRDGQSRLRNKRWQRDLRRYLLSGDAVILVRTAQSGTSKATLRAVRRGGVLVRVPGQRIYRTPH